MSYGKKIAKNLLLLLFIYLIMLCFHCLILKFPDGEGIAKIIETKIWEWPNKLIVFIMAIINSYYYAKITRDEPDFMLKMIIGFIGTAMNAILYFLTWIPLYWITDSNLSFFNFSYNTMIFMAFFFIFGMLYFYVFNMYLIDKHKKRD